MIGCVSEIPQTGRRRTRVTGDDSRAKTLVDSKNTVHSSTLGFISVRVSNEGDRCICFSRYTCSCERRDTSLHLYLVASFGARNSWALDRSTRFLGPSKSLSLSLPPLPLSLLPLTLSLSLLLFLTSRVWRRKHKVNFSELPRTNAAMVRNVWCIRVNFSRGTGGMVNVWRL